MLVNKSDAQLPVFILHLDQRRLNIVAALGTKQLHSSIDLLRVLIAPFGQCLFWGIWGIFQHCPPPFVIKRTSLDNQFPRFLIGALLANSIRSPIAENVILVPNGICLSPFRFAMLLWIAIRSLILRTVGCLSIGCLSIIHPPSRSRLPQAVPPEEVATGKAGV